jgi:Ser-Thr-rich glycosyl-phosphatidyl-inositol-anchored membrane family
MRLTCASICLLGVFVQKVISVTLIEPSNGFSITAGISFQVGWQWDSLPNPSNDGTMDILLVTDISASTVIAKLDANVSPLGLSTSATIPLNVTNGKYYIQLKVTSGNEKTAVNGPFNIVGGSPSSSSSAASHSQTTSASHSQTTSASGYQTTSAVINTDPSASQSFTSAPSSSLSKGVTAIIAISGVLVVVGFLDSRS